MKNKHATGPWKIDGNMIRSASGGAVAESCAGYQAMRYANSALIAAAPELLEALELLQSATKHYFRDFDHLHPSIGEPLAVAETAIARARGLP